MQENPHLQSIVSRIVNRIAMQFPVRYICNIIFYAGRQRIGNCAWTSSGAEYTFPFETPELNGQNHKVEVHVIDMDGAARTLRLPLGAFI